jgi:Phosphorylase superfamily
VITIVAATGLEANAARGALPPGTHIEQAGIALSHRRRFEDIAISCGIAGGLRNDLPTGTVLIPRSVRSPAGETIACDDDLVQAFLNAARELGYDPVDAPLLTSATFVVGLERSKWAAQGYAGVDMETGIIDAPRLACVRVILDTPEREISTAWAKPASVLFHPGAWRDLPFLAREGPCCARIAAEVIRVGLPRIR